MMDLNEIRNELDKIDSQIVDLLAKRNEFMPAVAEYKKKNNMPRVHPEREKQIIDSKRKQAEEKKLNPDFVEKIYKDIFEESHRIQKEIIGD